MTGDPTATLRARLRAVRDPVAVSPRLALMLPDRARIPELVGLIHDRRIARWTLHIPYPYRTEVAREWLRRAPKNRRAGTGFSLFIVRRSDGALVGGTGLHAFSADHGRAEIGYWIGRPFRRQGYAAEAVNALRGFAFARLGLHRLEARVFPGNAGSIGVLRSTGFRREGRLRESIVKNGVRRDELVYSTLAGDGRSSGRGAGRRRRSPSAPTR